ncbi:hypothetical protein EYM_07585 [Ignicoccus islandicus DSM 13165]|uniref:Uncharacterized protein n=1 Tax=Ignicoccus islandicus DSM 13165 TaxID=940295 RepID=A0A0U3F5D5_9CREN|nr:hypothetical protein [Ignicoccus islandicus]ALU12789.1 hypothetical protein EYM_07585 [Ignicoccus islandicus DSM 13165]
MITLIEFLKVLIQYALLISLPLSYNLTHLDNYIDVHHITEYSNYIVNDCKISILRLSPGRYIIPQAKITIFVSPQMLASQKSFLLSSLQKLLQNKYEVYLVKLRCPDYPHLNDLQLRKFFNGILKSQICYGWGPEAYYCDYVDSIIKIRDSPMGSYELFLNSTLLDSSKGSQLAIKYLIKSGKLKSLGVSRWIYVNHRTYAIGSQVTPSLLDGNVDEIFRLADKWLSTK